MELFESKEEKSKRLESESKIKSEKDERYRTELQVKNTTYRLQLVQVVSGNLYALTELIKKHNDYRSRVNDDRTVDVAMFIHRYRMDSPYINDDTGKQDFKGYAQVELAVLPEITPDQIQSAIDNGSDGLRGLIIVDGTNYFKLEKI